MFAVLIFLKIITCHCSFFLSKIFAECSAWKCVCVCVCDTHNTTHPFEKNCYTTQRRNNPKICLLCLIYLYHIRKYWKFLLGKYLIFCCNSRFFGYCFLSVSFLFLLKPFLFLLKAIDFLAKNPFFCWKIFWWISYSFGGFISSFGHLILSLLLLMFNKIDIFN